jgi:luciferase-like monooxygenase
VLVAAAQDRNPALLAKIVAGIDQMSDGRFEFGIGAGWKPEEYRAYGIRIPGSRRSRRAAEGRWRAASARGRATARRATASTTGPMTRSAHQSPRSILIRRSRSVAAARA